jgi:hypothetical protein
LIALGVARAPAHAAAPDPFAFFQPTVLLTAGERKQLERGEPLARVIPGEGREVAVFAAMTTTIDGDRLLAGCAAHQRLKKNHARARDLADLPDTALEDEWAHARGGQKPPTSWTAAPGTAGLALSDGMRTLGTAAALQTSTDHARNARREGAYQGVMSAASRYRRRSGLATCQFRARLARDVLRPADTLSALDHAKFYQRAASRNTSRGFHARRCRASSRSSHW